MNYKYIMTTESADRVGIVAALTNCLATHDGFINELAQFGTPSSLNFFSRIEFTMSAENLEVFKTKLADIIRRFDLRVNIVPTSERVKALTMTSEDLIAIGRDVESQTLARAVKLHSEHRSFLNGRKTVILP